MLEHPWLQKEDNYDFKYTDREYEVMMLKKELKNQMKGGASTQQDDNVLEDRQEMNELIESDPELYGADIEDIPPRKTKEKKNAKDSINNNDLVPPKSEAAGILSATAENDRLIFQDIFDLDEISLQDPEEERETFKTR